MALNIIQIGLNTADLPASLQLYVEAFGFHNAGAQLLMGETIQVQGLPSDSLAALWWLVGGQPLFQLELFHHSRPRQRPLRPDWSPADHGWVRMGVAVADFDASLAVLEQYGIRPIAGITIVHGLRRMAFRDPYIGIIVEVMEDGVAAPAIVYAATSVADLAGARAFYGETLGLNIGPVERLHPPGSDALWGLPEARSAGFLADNGGVIIEVVQYDSPVGRLRPGDYRASDQGMVNVAFGAPTKAPVAEMVQRLRAAGYAPPHIIDAGPMLACYITDPEREIELAVLPDELADVMGLHPAAPFFGVRLLPD